MNLPQTLVDRLRANRIIPFVGAGVSMSVKRIDSKDALFPSWKELLQRAVVRLNDEGKGKYANAVHGLIELGESEDFLEAARKASVGLGANWNNFLLGQFGHSSADAADGSLELARLVWKLHSRLVITTNYDRVLQWACPRPHDLDVWKIEAPANQAAMLRGELKHPVVWHLHGHVDDIANMILTPDGYRHLYNDGSQSETRYKAALATLNHQLASHSFLFIGFSLNDAHFSAQLRQVEQIYQGANGPHYVLLPRAEAGRLNPKDYPTTIEVVVYDDHGPPLLAKLRELIAAAETVEGPETPGHGAAAPIFRERPDSGAKGPAETTAGPSEFDDRVGGVKHTIKIAFDQLKDRRMVDDQGRVIGVLDQTAEKIKLSRSPEGGDLSDQLADFLTKRRDYRDLGKILIVFQRLRQQRKHEEARRIGAIMDRMLPLCLPSNLVAEAWRQLKKDEKLIRSGVGGKMGAELLVARLYWRPADFVDKNTSEPRGKRFVALYEDVPIGDPDASESAMLRDLYRATHHAEVKEIDGQMCEIGLTIDQIRERLSGHFEHISDFEECPAYCVVKLPNQENDVINLANFLRQLNLPGLIFIGIAPKRDQDVDRIEGYLVQNLNTRSTWENES